MIRIQIVITNSFQNAMELEDTVWLFDGGARAILLCSLWNILNHRHFAVIRWILPLIQSIHTGHRA